MVNSQLGDIYPFPPLPPVSNTQPFTQRDGASFLQILENLKQFCITVQDEWIEFQKNQSDFNTSLEALWKSFVAQYLNDFANLEEELKDLIEQAGGAENLLIWSVYGNREPIEHAIALQYDANRIHALFVEDFEALHIAPKDFDALNIAPRVFDMHSTSKVNAVLGDITSSNITWLNPNSPELTPEQEQLAKVFLVRNPTAQTFSNGN